MFFKSIRFKIILWQVLILAVTFFLFSILLYHNFSRSLYENLDDLLQSKAEGTANSIDAYWETEKLEATENGKESNVFSKINNVNFAKIAQRWVKEKSSDPRLMDIIVQIFDVNGENIISSKNIPNTMNLAKETFNYVSKGNYYFNNLNIESSEGKQFPLRLLGIPVIENNKVAYIVQVAGSLIPLHLALNTLRARLFLFLPLIVFLTGIAGMFLAKLTLKPVDNMIETVRQITADNLQLRIDIPDTKDEIKKLAETFNDMLNRLNKSFSSQQLFIQDVSHELKTPLTTLKGEIEIALKRIRSVQEYDSILHSSLEDINRINRLVEDLLVLTRFDNREVPLETKSLDLSILIERVVDDIKILAEQKNIKIFFSEQDGVVLDVDENKIRRVFLNILDNAIKYTPQNGKVTLSLEKENNLARIQISDTGIGIPEDELPHIFDRFYRVDKSRSSYGSGLGLSIAKSIVETHRGSIDVESRSGQGTTFTISLPYPVIKS
ncbi:MAG: heavy metal sensor histidine kinase [Candidatus Omnitrophica bacterium]|nr:heavy metal sensor histidine kinase [Candidatus Omnitrophota bacterium]